MELDILDNISSFCGKKKQKELYVNLTCQQNDISGHIMNHAKERKELIRIITMLLHQLMTLTHILCIYTVYTLHIYRETIDR